ncbi:MAG: hypothetical protein GY714_07845 [Desulfobacterales bacterium]|nr:hypothetical protein [Desulfobacterales bacterium]MCP4158662.1 hypothetical protein [Deltaproteobacteria bacterium]
MSTLKRTIIFLSLILLLPCISIASNGSFENSGEPAPRYSPKRLDQESLDGLVVQIVYVQRRYDDAMRIANILRDQGITVSFNKIGDSMLSYSGMILYKSGYQGAANKIISLIEPFEKVTPKLGNPKYYKEKHFNLWVTEKKISRLSQANLNKLIVQIVYIQKRYEDAMSIANILRNNGAKVKFNKTSDTGNSAYSGKILYKSGYLDSANQIAGLINDFEIVKPQKGTPRFYKDKHFNLWVASKSRPSRNSIADMRGLTVQIVYTDKRYDDAMSIANILRDQGVKVIFNKTRVGYAFAGKILYKDGYLRVARKIAGLVKGYEKLTPQRGKTKFYKNKQFNLWVTK